MFGLCTRLRAAAKLSHRLWDGYGVEGSAILNLRGLTREWRGGITQEWGRTLDRASHRRRYCLGELGAAISSILSILLHILTDGMLAITG